jgi:hypothetical protein
VIVVHADLEAAVRWLPPLTDVVVMIDTAELIVIVIFDSLGQRLPRAMQRKRPAEDARKPLSNRCDAVVAAGDAVADPLEIGAMSRRERPTELSFELSELGGVQRTGRRAWRVVASEGALPGIRSLSKRVARHELAESRADASDVLHDAIDFDLSHEGSTCLVAEERSGAGVVEKARSSRRRENRRHVSFEEGELVRRVRDVALTDPVLASAPTIAVVGRDNESADQPDTIVRPACDDVETGGQRLERHAWDPREWNDATRPVSRGREAKELDARMRDGDERGSPHVRRHGPRSACRRGHLASLSYDPDAHDRYGLLRCYFLEGGADCQSLVHLRELGAAHGWTPREIEHAAFSMQSRTELSRNAGLSFARFSVLRFPHQDKERFVNAIEWGALVRYT